MMGPSVGAGEHARHAVDSDGDGAAAANRERPSITDMRVAMYEKTEGDIAIAIEWYDRTEDDDEGLSFVKWVDTNGGAAVQNIINSTELRAASSTPFDNGLHFTMAAEVETPMRSRRYVITGHGSPPVRMPCWGGSSTTSRAMVRARASEQSDV